MSLSFVSCDRKSEYKHVNIIAIQGQCWYNIGSFHIWLVYFRNCCLGCTKMVACGKRYLSYSHDNVIKS